MLEQRKLQPQDSLREQEFIRRYSQLLTWAMRLTNNHRASAEDLVQDAFIQFTRVRTNLESIENVDGYLYRMLRNMHISRLGRRTEQVKPQIVSLADLEWELDSPGHEFQQRLQTHEELCRVCHYACIRKETSRAGSILILRFFLEYSPSEIAEVLCTSRHCVDQWQRLARRELKVYLESPQRLRFVTTSKWDPLPAKPFVSHNWPNEFRRLVCSSRQGPCISPNELMRTYKADAAESLTTTRLAHIVSCDTCLDEVNRILGLPSLEHRLPKQSNERRPPTSGSGSGGGSDEGPTDVSSRLQRHVDLVVNQRPKELHISVDGLPVGILKTSSGNSEVHVNLSAEGPANFVEIVSEHGVPLLFYTLDQESYGLSEQWAQLELTEGRSLETRICENGSSLVLQVSYQQDASLTHVVGSAFRKAAAIHEQQNLSPTQTAIVPQNPFIHVTPARKSVIETVREFVRAGGTLCGQTSWFNPQLATVVIATLLITGLLSVWLRTSAESILNRAVVAEEQDSRSGIVLHRVLRFESKRVGDLTPAVETIDIWEDKANGKIARRVYDAENVLIAGEWRKSDGTHFVYHHRTGLKSVATPDELNQILMLSPWRLDLSPKTFRSMFDPAELEVVKGPTDYTISWKGMRAIASVKLVTATLTVTNSDFRVIRQSLEVERSDGRYEFSFVQLNAERLPEQEILPEYFSPDSFVKPRSSPVVGSARPNVRIDSSDRMTHVLATASTELEIEVAYLLNRAKSDRNEQIALTRTRTGSLLIEGVVETEERKKEIEAVLDPISKHSLVRIALQTVADASKISGRAITSVKQGTNTGNTIAVDPELRDYLRSQSVSDIDEAVRQLSATVVQSSYRALFHAIELKRLKTRFSNNELRSVSPDAHNKWTQMVHQHANGYLVEVANIKRILGPLFFSKMKVQRPDTHIAMTNDDELGKAIDRIWQIALANNRIVRDAFTISSDSSGLAVTSPNFWQSLITSEILASQIKRNAEQ